MTEQKFNIQRQKRIFEQVANQIINYIKSNNLKPGTKLPAERQLCQLLEVSRSSIRESIKILELLGYIKAKQGEGTFVQVPPLFTIPGRSLHCAMAPNDLAAYYNVFVMCSAKIVLTSLKAHIETPQNFLETGWNSKHCDNYFFNSLINWILYLVKKDDTIPTVSLWTETYMFLLDYNYFNQSFDHFSQDIKPFLSAYHLKDRFTLINLFDQLDLK